MTLESMDIETLIEEFTSIVEEALSVQESLYSSYQPCHIFNIEINDCKHILVLFVSDIHLGSIYTDYSKVLKFWNFILQKENIYLILNGDFIDNFDVPSTKHLIAGVNSQLLTPELQRELLIKFISALVAKKKLLACVLGNHESFSHQYPYFRIIQNVPLSSNRMLLNLKVAYQTYKIALIHKSRFNSILNPLHSSYRELTTLYPDADIVVTSHTHLPAFSVLPYPANGKYLERVLIKTGTLKVDSYTTSNFAHPSPTESAIPCVVLNPLARKITPFMNYEDAYRFLLISIP